MFINNFDVCLEVPGLPADLRLRLHDLLTDIRTAEQSTAVYTPYGMVDTEWTIVNDFKSHRYLNEQGHLKKLIESSRDSQSVALVHNHMLRRCRFVISALRLQELEQKHQARYEMLAADLKELRRLIEGRPADDPLVGFTEGVALTLNSLSNWKRASSFNDLIAQSDGLTTDRALEAMVQVYHKVTEGTLEFPDNLFGYHLRALTFAEDEPKLQRLSFAIDDAQKMVHLFAAALQTFGWCKENYRSEYYSSILESAITGSPLMFERSTSVPFNDALHRLETDGANFHAATQQLVMWYEKLQATRNVLIGALEAALAVIKVPTLYYLVIHQFDPNAPAYRAMANCIIAKAVLADVDGKLAEYEKCKKHFQEPLVNPVKLIDSVLAKTV